VGGGVKLESIGPNDRLETAEAEAMTPSARRGVRRRAAASVALALAASVAVGGCGTPAVVKPASTPLPGLARDIHAARSVVAQAQRQAQSDASSAVAAP
jgi:hypothetical protein